MFFLNSLAFSMIHIYITESLCCRTEISTTLQINYISIKKNNEDFLGGPVLESSATVGDTGLIPAPRIPVLYMPWGNQAQELQLLSPCALEPMLHNRSHCSEKPMHHNEEQHLFTPTRESPGSNKDPVQPKIKKERKNEKQTNKKEILQAVFDFPPPYSCFFLFSQ